MPLLPPVIRAFLPSSFMFPAFERGFEEILSAGGGDRKEGIFQTAALLGGVVLARAVQDPQLSDEMLEGIRQKVSY
jgi:TetR/AcrR family transcriptional regulator, transcriptional repressor for nem operon